MADFGQGLADAGVNMGINRGLNAVGVHSPVPIPGISDIRNFAQGGDARARAAHHYGHQLAAASIDRGVYAINPGLGLLNSGVKLFGGLIGKDWGAGAWITNAIDRPSPTGTVGGQPAVTTSDSTTAGDYSINPWTGERLSGTAASQSPFGPYAAGYQGLPQQPSDNGPVMPDFSHYGDLDQFDAPPSGGGDGGGSGGSGGMQGNSNGGWLAGGGLNGVMNGASNNMLSDFAAPLGGDYMALIKTKTGQGAAAVTHGASMR